MNKVGVNPTTGVLLCVGNMLYWNLMLSSEVPPDPRQESWILMQSQVPTLVMSLAYVLGSTWLGPKLMENRKPFTGLRPFMVAYNAFQVVFCSWLVFEVREKPEVWLDSLVWVGCLCVFVYRYVS